MEQLISLGMEALQNVAERAASYRFGQSTLRQLDRVLWVVEKCARWAVPPPLDQEERPQPELVRPLPWLFFFMMLVTLRVTRESISLLNLIMGKPPLRSADVVMFIQSKRRYLRTLKYQGNRMMRARTSTQPREPWYSGLSSLFELTMCFRRQSQNYGNNNTTQVTNNDEVMVITRNKRVRQEETAVVASLRETEATMERLIEKMMTDLDAESDEESSYTLNSASSPKSDISEYTEADQDTICQTSSPNQPLGADISQTNGDDIHFSPNKNENSSSTPEKTDVKENHAKEEDTSNQTYKVSETAKFDKSRTENSISENVDEKRRLDENITESAYTGSGDSVSEIRNYEFLKYENGNSGNVNSKSLNSGNVNSENINSGNVNSDNINSGNVNSENINSGNVPSKTVNSGNMNSVIPETCEDSALSQPEEEKQITPKQDSENFINNERAASAQRTPKKDQKIANGRTVKSGPSKKKVNNHRERRHSNEAHQQRALPSQSSF